VKIILHTEGIAERIMENDVINRGAISGKIVSAVMFQLAKEFPNEIIAWCDVRLESECNAAIIAEILHHQKMMVSYNPSPENFLGKVIGFVDESIFINVNKEVCYPTWQMSGFCGAIHASVLNAIAGKIPINKNFDYYLNSIAKTLMPLGLICYSEPRLLRKKVKVNQKNAPLSTVYQFVKQHYKTRWVLLLFLNLFIYEKRFTLLGLLSCLFLKKIHVPDDILEGIEVQSSKQKQHNLSIDVLFPTIGREKYLYDFLHDLMAQ